MRTGASRKPDQTGAPTAVELDDAAVDVIVAEVEAAVVSGRGTVTFPRKGRPSLTGSPAPSPSIGFRVTPQLRREAEAVAVRQGISVSELARAALEEYVRRAR